MLFTKRIQQITQQQSFFFRCAMFFAARTKNSLERNLNQKFANLIQTRIQDAL